MQSVQVMRARHSIIAVPCFQNLYQTMGQLLLIVACPDLDSIRTAELFLCVHSFHPCKAMLLDKEVQMMDADLLANGSVCKDCFKLRMVISFSRHLLPLKYMLPVLCRFL